ncbi:MAG: hypothetical protein M3171_10525 [Actinomycetota bacterium]|nr:hypothetical protein [Actinomycetota bacterium]
MSDRPPPQDAPPPEAEQLLPPALATTHAQMAQTAPTAPRAATAPLAPMAPMAPMAPTAPPEPTAAPPQAAAEPPAPSQANGRPEVTYLPAPSGPSWGLVALGLLFVLVAGGVVANQLLGFQVTQLSEVGPSVLVIGGLACAAVGAVGILARRR